MEMEMAQRLTDADEGIAYGRAALLFFISLAFFFSFVIYWIRGHCKELLNLSSSWPGSCHVRTSGCSAREWGSFFFLLLLLRSSLMGRIRSSMTCDTNKLL